MINFFTLAGNQMNSEPSGVDPHMGQFSIVIQLGHINGNKLRGPALPFNLNYQPFATQDYGFGLGWALPWTTYDPNTGAKGTLFTSEGSNFKVTKDSNPSITQQKPTALNFSKFPDGAYMVTHAHGGVEVLGTQVNAIAVPSQIFTPLGNSFTLTWQQTPYGITSILDDESNKLLSATYNRGSSATLTLNPDSDEEIDINAVISGQLLQSITIGDWTWSFSYTDVGVFGSDIPQLLYKIVHPTGLVEEATYTANIMAFPAISGKTTKLPAVTTYTKTPNGGQPPQICQYEYQGNGDNPMGNFLGSGGSFQTWDDDRDNLYYAAQSYRYTTLCKEMSGGTVVSTIERTFDQFHCIRNETRTKGQCTCETDYAYDGQNPGTFDNQSNTFLMPTKTTTTYSGPSGSRLEYFTATYDSTYGDKTQHVTFDGVTTAYEYYPLAGDGDNCPPSPSGFDRLVKSITTTYPDRNSYDGYTRVKSYTHCQVDVGGDPSNKFNPIPYAACPLLETMTIGGTTIHTLEYEYNDKLGDKDHGRVKTVTETVYDDDETGHVSTTAFTYTHDIANGQLSVVKAFTAEDASTSATTSVSSMVSGREVSSFDELNVETDYTYDVHSREKTRTMAVGTDYERTLSFDYAFEKLYTTDTVTILTKTTTHPSGAQEKVWYDGSLRAVKHQKYITTTSYTTGIKPTTYNAWMDVATSTYNDQGHLISTQEFDYRNKTTSLLSPTTTLSYDDWGQNNLTTYASGRFAGSDHDPVANMATLTWSSGQNASRVIQYNDQKLPETVTVYDKDGNEYSTTNSEYDGAWRLRQHTDELGNIVQIDYDVWSRPRKITLPDGSVVTRTYEKFCGLELISEITAYDPTTDTTTSLGTQTHDGLHRVTETVVGGRKTTHHYANSGPVPDSTIEPDGTQVNYTYIDALGSALETSTAGSLTLTLGYDSKGGWLTSASDGSGPDLSLSLDEWGNLNSRTLTFDGTRTRTENYGNSAFGRPLAFVDVGNDRTAFNYNSSTGLPLADITALTSVSYTFTNGALTGWTAGQSTVTLTLDEFLRETDRSVTRGSSTFDLSQKYYANGLLKQQTTKLGSTTLRDDNYEYDERNRVTVFTSAGAALAIDPYGKSLTKQEFDYDVIDNLTSVTTTFTGGIDNATYTYDDTDPCQLKSITHDGPGYPSSISLSYDHNGRMTIDDAGRTLGYDPFGRLDSIDTGKATTSYFYDGLGVRREQQLQDGSSLEYYYRGHYPIAVIKHTDSGDSTTRWLRVGGNCMVEKGPDGSLKDIISDTKASVIATGDGSGLEAKGYAAYGYAPPDDSAQSALGYNGEYTDPVTGNYHLGNGYRAFSPVLMRFTAPDSLSPFGGGLNTYAYCDGDPINAIDPTGHMKWYEWAGLIVGTVALAAVGGYDAYAAWAAFQAIQKFAEIAEEADEASEIANAASKLARLNKFRAAWHGIFAVKNTASFGLQVGIDYATVHQKMAVIYNGGTETWRNGSSKFLQWASPVQMGLGATELLRLPLGGVSWWKGRSFENQLSGARARAGFGDAVGQRVQFLQGFGAHDAPATPSGDEGRIPRPRPVAWDPPSTPGVRRPASESPSRTQVSYDQPPPPPAAKRELAGNTLRYSDNTKQVQFQTRPARTEADPRGANIVTPTGRLPSRTIARGELAGGWRIDGGSNPWDW
jgi:RHS repeat-associated protein